MIACKMHISIITYRMKTWKTTYETLKHRIQKLEYFVLKAAVSVPEDHKDAARDIKELVWQIRIKGILMSY